MNILVITVSDRASQGIYEDLSGPAIEKILLAAISGCSVSRRIVSDDSESILRAFEEAAETDVIITTGGTGLSPRDITPEVTIKYCDRLIPGIAELIRSESFKKTRNAMLSRGVAGMKRKTLIVNFPGSVKAAEFCTHLVAPVLSHAIKMARGEEH